MHIRLLCFAIICLVPLASPAQENNHNPFRNAKVGDYVAYKQTTMFLGKNIEISMRETVTAKNDKELTLRTTGTVSGTALPSHDAKIDLTKPYDPATAMTQADPTSKFEQTGAGKEKIKIGDKTYDCAWIAGKQFDKGGKHTTDVKIWFSKSVPLTGRVKVETKSTFGEVTKREIAGWGSQK
jgi:hypothetical protein